MESINIHFKAENVFTKSAQISVSHDFWHQWAWNWNLNAFLDRWSQIDHNGHVLTLRRAQKEFQQNRNSWRRSWTPKFTEFWMIPLHLGAPKHFLSKYEIRIWNGIHKHPFQGWKCFSPKVPKSVFHMFLASMSMKLKSECIFGWIITKWSQWTRSHPWESSKAVSTRQSIIQVYEIENPNLATIEFTCCKCNDFEFFNLEFFSVATFPNWYFSTLRNSSVENIALRTYTMSKSIWSPMQWFQQLLNQTNLENANVEFFF